MMNDDEAVKGAHKAAAFLLSMDQEVAAEVLRHMDRTVVAEVAAAMGELDPSLTQAGAVGDLYRDLVRILNTPVAIRPSSDEELRSVLSASFGEEQADEVLAQIHERRRTQRPFAFLESQDPEKVGAVLAEEQPGVIAVVLTHVEPALSAPAIATLGTDTALEVVRRMATSSPPGPEILASIADTLRERIEALDGMPKAPDPGESLKTIAEMLNHSNQEVEASVLEGIEDEDEEMAAGIRECMFTWNDLSTVDKRSMQKILATVDTRTLAISLKGSNIEVEENIVANLSARVQDMVMDERDLAGAVPMNEVQAARNEVLKGVRTLMDSGEFRPSRSGEELVS